MRCHQIDINCHSIDEPTYRRYTITYHSIDDMPPNRCHSIDEILSSGCHPLVVIPSNRCHKIEDMLSNRHYSKDEMP